MLCYYDGGHPRVSCAKLTVKCLRCAPAEEQSDETRGLRLVMPDRIPFARGPYPDRLWPHLVGRPSFGRNVGVSVQLALAFVLW